MALKDRQKLARSEAATAWIPMVSDNTKKGKPRRIFLPKLAKAQKRVNPFVFTQVQRVPLIEYSGVDAANRASQTASNDLAIKEETTRHSFDDDYYMFEIEVVTDSFTGSPFAPPLFISAARFNASSSTDRIICNQISGVILTVWRENSNSFRINWSLSNGNVRSQLTGLYFKSIHGHKLAISRKES